MPRKPLIHRLPDDPKAAIRRVESDLSRLQVEVDDHRLHHWGVLNIPNPAAASPNAGLFQQANLLLLPTRNRVYFRLAASARLAGWTAGTHTLTITLFTNGVAAGNRLFQVALSLGANGWTSGSTSTIMNAGRENVPTTVGWHLEAIHTVAGGPDAAATWNDIGIEAYYRDFVPHYR